MLQKIKDAVLYVVTPLAILAGYIYYLLGRNEALERKIALKEADQNIKDLVSDARKAEEGSKDARKNYEDTRDKYLREHGDSES